MALASYTQSLSNRFSFVWKLLVVAVFYGWFLATMIVDFQKMILLSSFSVVLFALLDHVGRHQFIGPFQFVNSFFIWIGFWTFMLFGASLYYTKAPWPMYVLVVLPIVLYGIGVHSFRRKEHVVTFLKELDSRLILSICGGGSAFVCSVISVFCYNTIYYTGQTWTHEGLIFAVFVTVIMYKGLSSRAETTSLHEIYSTLLAGCFFIGFILIVTAFATNGILYTIITLSSNGSETLTIIFLAGAIYGFLNPIWVIGIGNKVKKLLA